jgi:DNA-binding transcriptional LysR family regulator
MDNKDDHKLSQLTRDPIDKLGIDIDHLDRLVRQVRNLMHLSPEDIYLTIYALENSSLERAEDVKGEVFQTRGARARIKKVNEVLKDYLRIDDLFIERYGAIKATESGRIFVREMANVITHFCEALDQIRVNRGRLIRIAATTFMMESICKVYPKWRKILEDGKIELNLIKTAEVEKSLLNHEADLVFGACAGPIDDSPSVHKGLEFYPIKNETVGILTNISQIEIRDEDDFRRLLKRARLVIPERGLMYDFAQSLFKRYPEASQRSIEWCNDVFFGLSILENEIVADACMFVLEGVAFWIQGIQKSKTANQAKLVYVPLPLSLLDQTVYVGLFRRQIDSKLDEGHPLQRFWKVFCEEYS